MSTIVQIIIQLVAGAVGGNLAGAARNLSLGPAGNTIAGAIGGLGGGWLATLIPALQTTAESFDITALLGQIVGGGAGGAILTAIVGMVRNMMGGAQTS